MWRALVGKSPNRPLSPRGRGPKGRGHPMRRRPLPAGRNKLRWSIWVLCCPLFPGIRHHTQHRRFSRFRIHGRSRHHTCHIIRYHQTMTTLSIRVPDSLHRAIKELATKDGYSMNQFLITAAAEKLSALETVAYLRPRAERANLKDFDSLLGRVPDSDPDAGDELPPKHSSRPS